ncbi:MAG: DUF885 domain-containing protein [Acidobacteria bacterium]|nr:DUF885 domain-containing protein [Acidobacteriota bacterium]MCI0620269.1 DUF885 domain-containing protein [Acidobacteriota bacterium]MCI0722973.1 DUF885 domain-containing protein [Acidobacteriota bacterium]
MKTSMLLSWNAALLFLLCCATPQSEDLKFEALAKEYLDKLLERNPELATSLGDHRFDERMNDYTQSGIQAQVQFQRQSVERLGQIDVSKLNSVNRIDFAILQSEIQSSLFQLENLREHEWNPQFYNVGNAIYGLTAREFAPLKDRLKSVKARLRAIPTVLAAAKANLKNPPRIHTETAILQNKGNLSLVREELKTYLDQVPELIPEFASVQSQVIAAFESYGSWLEKEVLPKASGNFRIGENKFRDKLRYTLESDLSLEEILQRALADLQKTQEALFETALPLSGAQSSGSNSAERRKVIKTVLDKLAESRPSNETIVEAARANLQEITEFMRQKGLVTVPEEPVKIIVMPEFQRGVAVAYCDSPGPLEKHGETFYAISPTPADWPQQRVVSFFREYNNYMLKNLTIHEAMPGHYLQLAHSNKFKAPTLIRTVFTSGVFTEGWATYAEQLMVEKGYGGPEVKVQQLKMRLRLIINAILDQKIHTAGMSEKEAMDLMMNEGFQEEGEAAGKWRRACLSSTQLSTYYVGNTEINEIRKAWEAKRGPIHDLKAFHDTVLSFGSPPPKYVKGLLGL